MFSIWLENRKVIEKAAKDSKIDLSKYKIDQVIKGFKVEMEHGPADKKTDVTGGNPVKTLKIAIAHLNEDPDYYTKLEKVEKD